MLFSTPTQFAVLLLLLVIGWLFGFASHPGGRKWRAAHDTERARARTLEARVAELEKDNALLAARRADSTPVAATAASPMAASAVAASAARPAFSDGVSATPARRSWFDWTRDDLTRLRGVDADLAKRLASERVERFRDLAGLTDQDEIALERRIDLPAGYIQREQLREQARLLADNQNAEHAAQFGGTR